MATVDGLTPKQHKALAALMSEPTVTAAAAKVGIGERTLHTWLHESAFADAYTAYVTRPSARLSDVSSTPPV